MRPCGPHRVGELTPLPGRWDGLSDKADSTNGPLRYLLHRDQHGDVDGVANFRLPWSPTAGNAGTLIVEALDNLWARLLNVPRALTQRSYDSPGELIFTIVGDRMCPANNGTWRLNADIASVTCVPTNEAAELTTSTAAFSSLYLGGMSAHDLAYAGHLIPHTDSAIGRLSRLLRVDPEPHNSFGF